MIKYPKFSEHFTVAECLKSTTADEHNLKEQYLPSNEVQNNLLFICSKAEIPRKVLGVNFNVNSAYRCLALNRLIGSNDNSDHVKGLALDLSVSEEKIKNFADIKLLLLQLGIENNNINNNFRLFLFCIFNAQSMHLKQIIHEKGNFGNPNWIHIGFYASSESYIGTRITIYDGKQYTNINIKEIILRLGGK